MFDLLVLSVLGLSTAFAALRGGVRELATLLALAVAGGVTLLIAQPLLGATGLAGSFFGAIIVAALVMTVVFIAAHIGLHFAMQRFPLAGRVKLVDRIGGGAFGFVRGLVLVGLGYLGYSYYLDEARQPEEVRSALTRPLAAGMAHWFQSFTPDDAYIEQSAPSSVEDPAENGYDRADRNGLSEIVTTVTTTDEPSVQSGNQDDPIAEILEEDDAE
ncbi:MAG: CvpA family protein [Hyphococcus sp.]